MASINYRTLNVDLYDPESPQNFPISTLIPASQPQSSQTPPVTDPSSANQTNTHIRGILRSGDSLAALTAALSSAPLSPTIDDNTKSMHLSTVLEVLQGIRQSDASRVLGEMMQTQGGSALADTLMKYIYKGMAGGGGASGGGKGMSPQSTGSPGRAGFSQIQARNVGGADGGGSAQAMSVLLSWHEKLVEVVGVGGIVRVMSDRRTV